MGSKRTLVKPSDEEFSYIISLIMEANKEHEMNATEAVGYVIAKWETDSISVGKIEYVRYKMAEAFEPLD